MQFVDLFTVYRMVYPFFSKEDLEIKIRNVKCDAKVDHIVVKQLRKGVSGL